MTPVTTKTSAPISLACAIAWRYATGAGKRISFVGLTAIAGLALSVAVLIIVLSVVNGFDRELQERVLAVVPHVSAHGRVFLPDDERTTRELEAQSGVVGAARFVQDAGLLSTSGKALGTLLHGIDPAEYERVSRVGRFLQSSTAPHLEAGQYRLWLGADLARDLGVTLGATVNVILPAGTVTPLGALPRQRQFTVVNVFKTQSDLDDNSAFMHIEDAKKLFRTGGRIGGYQLRLEDLFELRAGFAAIDEVLGNYDVAVQTWTRRHGPIHQAIATQKVTMFVLLSFLVGVAAFNLVSGLVIVVEERKSDISVLRTMGGDQRLVLGLFVTLGFLFGGFGVLVGTLLGLGIATGLPALFVWMSDTLQLELMNQYFINYLPVQILGQDIFAIVVVSLVLTFAATLFPAWRATRLQPAEVLAHE